MYPVLKNPGSSTGQYHCQCSLLSYNLNLFLIYCYIITSWSLGLKTRFLNWLLSILWRSRDITRHVAWSFWQVWSGPYDLQNSARKIVTLYLSPFVRRKTTPVCTCVYLRKGHYALDNVVTRSRRIGTTTSTILLSQKMYWLMRN